MNSDDSCRTSRVTPGFRWPTWVCEVEFLQFVFDWFGEKKNNFSIKLEQQTVSNQSVHGKYNLISACFNKISRTFLCVHSICNWLYCMVNTFWFRFALIIFREQFSVCTALKFRDDPTDLCVDKLLCVSATGNAAPGNDFLQFKRNEWHVTNWLLF